MIEIDAEDCDPDAELDNPCAPELLFAAGAVEKWEASEFRDGRDVGHEFTHGHDASPHEGVTAGSLAPRGRLPGREAR